MFSEAKVLKKTKHAFFVILLLFSLSQIFFAGTDRPAAITRNISYVEDGNALQKLDVYFHPGKRGLPVLVFIHGGAWLTGDKIITGKQARRMAEHGFVFVSVNYRVSPFVAHPDHVLDCAKAVLWVKENILDFGGDSDSIFLAGYSAGGHLCALLACDPRYLRSVGMKPKQLKGYLIMGPGGMDLDRLSREEPPNALKGEFFKLIFGERTEWLDACPTTHLSGSESPLLVAVAEFDRLIDRADCIRFVEKSRLLGGDTHFFIIPGKNHLNAFLPLGKIEDPLTLQILRFVEKNR